MRTIRSPSILAALVCAVVVAAANAGVSDQLPSTSLGSANGLNYRSVSYSPFMTGSIDLYAKCRKDDAVLGGGVHVSGPAAKSRVGYGYPGDDDDPGSKPADYWIGAATNLAPADRTITTYGVCRKAGSAGVSYVSEQVNNVAAGDSASVSVKCPPGTSVAGGGSDLYVGEVTISAPFDSADAGGQPDDGWRVRARNENESASPEDIGVHAVCLPVESARLSYRSASGITAAGSAKTLATSCPRSSAVTGGGMEIEGGLATHFFHSTRPRDSGADPDSTPDNRWSVTAVNLGGSASKTTVHAICLG